MFFGRIVDENAVALTTPVGAVAAAGGFKDVMTTTSVVSDALVAGASVSTSSVAGSGASLSLTRDASGEYSVGVTSGGGGGGSPYAVGDTFTVDGTLVGGTSTTHDVIITVTSVDANGVIAGATANGFTPGLNQATTTISPNSTSGLGSGATFDITMVDGVATVAVNAVLEMVMMLVTRLPYLALKLVALTV